MLGKVERVVGGRRVKRKEWLEETTVFVRADVGVLTSRPYAV